MLLRIFKVGWQDGLVGKALVSLTDHVSSIPRTHIGEGLLKVSQLLKIAF